MKYFACLLTIFLATQAWSAENAAPNVVFFLVDDLGYSDVGFTGGKDIQTPHVDKLAKEGTILTAHYVQPVCSPTRAALMTGRYATHTGVYTIVRPHAKWGLPLEERTLANALKQAGYETAVVGKWHLGEFAPQYRPLSRGFDHQYGHYFGALDYYTHMRDGSHDWYRDDKEVHAEGYSTHLIADEACRLIAEKDPGKPLFLYVPFNGVHAPLQVPESYTEPYEMLAKQRKAYAGMMAAVDEAIGKIVGALEQAKIRDNTLLIFSSDNGGPSPGKVSSNGQLRAGKGTIYEGGVRVCACVNWPGHIPAGATVDEPMHIIDWYPTLVKLAGGSLEQKLPLDGKDVWPMLTEKAKSPHEAILSVQTPTQAALRMGDWKLLQFDRKNKAGKGAVELYNLADDLGEQNDLSQQEPKRAAAMQAKLQAMLDKAVPPGNEVAEK